MSAGAPAAGLSWLGILRLGLVQTALGAIVVLTTSTMNRVMVVELALPAMLPGALVAFHYAIQILRPRMGHGSDVGGRRTPWIVGGMAVLGAGAVLAALAIAVMEASLAAGIALAVVGFALIGLGVGAAGTTLLVLLAKKVAPERRAAAATIVWIMMIAGFAVTAGVAGQILDPFSAGRLVAVTAAVSIAALALTVVAVRGVERRVATVGAPAPASEAADGAVAQHGSRPAFREALAATWADPKARHFTVFVFVSMLAYSAQDLILEPFAGLVFGMTPGESTALAGLQHGGVVLGMLTVAVACSAFGRRTRAGALQAWTIGGCVASAIALGALTFGGLVGPGFPLRPVVFALGVANGAFAVAAIGSMMALAGADGGSREGVRMGLWGAAQAIAFGLGGFLGTVAVDAMRAVFGPPAISYGTVFAAEGLMFLVAAGLALRVARTGPSPFPRRPAAPAVPSRPEPLAAGFAGD
ncbi:MAG: BCD family MFS transporter [Azospirillaceae bacterium]